jgi:sugar phosphate isomerase/epimerase
MRELAESVDPEKIYFFQISDAEKMEPPLESREVEGMPPRARWSHAHRPVPGKGGYLPVKEMVKAVLKTGWRGWMSVEVFLEREHKKQWEAGLLDRWAKEGMESVKSLLEEVASEESS